MKPCHLFCSISSRPIGGGGGEIGKQGFQAWTPPPTIPSARPNHPCTCPATTPCCRTRPLKAHPPRVCLRRSKPQCVQRRLLPGKHELHVLQPQGKTGGSRRDLCHGRLLRDREAPFGLARRRLPQLPSAHYPPLFTPNKGGGRGTRSPWRPAEVRKPGGRKPRQRRLYG